MYKEKYAPAGIARDKRCSPEQRSGVLFYETHKDIETDERTLMRQKQMV